jgi:hypothetical protein
MTVWFGSAVRLAGAALLGTTMACGGASRPPSAGGEPARDRVDWANKSHQQKLEFMGRVVYPRMKRVFQSQDAAAYANFRCQTCHGEDMERKDFKMPNHLYALPVADPLKEANAYNPKVAAFMQEHVLPQMAEILDMPLAKAGTTEGFTCFNCHAKEQ